MLEWAKRGLVAGLSGAATVAAGVFLYDLILSEPLSTPDALARNLLGAAPPPADPAVASEGGFLPWLVSISEGAYRVALYIVAHFAAFVLLGLAGAGLFLRTRLPANVLTGALFGAVAGTVVFYAGFALLAPGSVSLPSTGLVVGLNALAGVVIVSQLVDLPNPV